VNVIFSQSDHARKKKRKEKKGESIGKMPGK
jgi:hypothetical protein